MPQYLLARHVFVCVQDEHVVFLDVRKDRYFALDSARTAGQGHFVPGWPVSAPLFADSGRYDSGSAAPVLAEKLDHGPLAAVISLLLEKGILLADASAGKTAEPIVPESVHQDCAADSVETRSRVRPGIVVRFVMAALRARLLLKHRTFESVVERVRLRREKAAETATMTRISESRLHQLVDSFATLRPFFFAAKDACLFDALALSEFLAGYGFHPRWVFAVQARPFAAHCWLQLGDTVLNDTVDHVRRYTPIMVV